ncbi:MAG TPA: hypothetical protein VK158_06085 [Acidobacteriota bacterium]|nr:hypothetical protein [Acidobacteriota bacterium]
MSKSKLQDSALFKNIGVDVSFVEQNASLTNDKMNDMFWNQNRTSRQATVSSGIGVQVQHVQPQYTQPVHHVAQQTLAPAAAPGTPAQVAIDHAVIAQLKAELQQYADSQIRQLAFKMQEFADQTDKKLASVEKLVKELEQRSLSAPTQSRPSSGGQEKKFTTEPTEDDNPAAAKVKAQNAISSADVAISKMFNFSHAGSSGKFQR